jgi:hypothetical protein
MKTILKFQGVLRVVGKPLVSWFNNIYLTIFRVNVDFATRNSNKLQKFGLE